MENCARFIREEAQQLEHERALLEQLITQGAAPEIILEQSQKLDRLIVDSYLERSIEGLKMS